MEKYNKMLYVNCSGKFDLYNINWQNLKHRCHSFNFVFVQRVILLFTVTAARRSPRWSSESYVVTTGSGMRPQTPQGLFSAKLAGKR